MTVGMRVLLPCLFLAACASHVEPSPGYLVQARQACYTMRAPVLYAHVLELVQREYEVVVDDHYNTRLETAPRHGVSLAAQVHWNGECSTVTFRAGDPREEDRWSVRVRRELGPADGRPKRIYPGQRQ